MNLRVKLRRGSAVLLLGSVLAALTASLLAQAPRTTPQAAGGIQFSFVDKPLQQIVDYLSGTGAFIVTIQPGVDAQTRFVLSSDKKLTPDQAVVMLKQALNGSGYTLTQNGKVLTISVAGPRPVTSGAADLTGTTAATIDTTGTTADMDTTAAGTPAATHAYVRWDLIPDDMSDATYIIAIRNADPAIIATNLESLNLQGSEMTNDPPDSITITGPHYNARRAARIISALDSTGSRGGVIEAFQVQSVDARALANVVKILAPARLARPGGTMKGASDSLMVIADPESNMLFVNTPDSLQASVESVEGTLDHDPSGEFSQQTFHLEQADADEVAFFFSSLFPNGAPPDRANGQSSGPTGAVEPSGRAPQGSAGVVAARRGRRPALILAVPNRQASIVIVSAPRLLMPMVSAIIPQLDVDASAGITRDLIPPGFTGEPAEVQQALNRVLPFGLYLPGAVGRAPAQPAPVMPRAPAINSDLSNTNIERVITPH